MLVLVGTQAMVRRLQVLCCRHLRDESRLPAASWVLVVLPSRVSL